MINLTKMIRDGRQKGRDKHKADEIPKLGTLRVGNSGIMSENGDVAGACHRKTMLRSMGVEIDPPDEKKLIMFELGYANEDVTMGLLSAALPEGHTILREADIPIDWLTTNGMRVTGRPDMVVCRQDRELLVDSSIEPLAAIGNVIVYDGLKPLVRMKNVPVLGIELKTVHSIWTAKKVLFEGKPGLSNLAQAGHYMWKLGIPYKLIYKCYSQLGQGMSWVRSGKEYGRTTMPDMFPAQGEPGSEYLSYNEKGMPLQVDQFEVVYDLEFDQHGRLKYRRESTDELNEGKWQYSLVSRQDIERYYNHVAELAQKKELGGRPMTVDAHGTRESYNMCNEKYCPLGAICDKYESKGFEKWFSEVKKLDNK